MRKQIRLLAVIGIISVLLTGVVYASLTDGLVSYFSFDTNADDDWASNDGTPYNVTHLTEGCVLDGCYYFADNGNGNHINISNEADFDFDCGDAWSVGMWVNLTKTHNVVLFMKGINSSTRGYCGVTNNETRYQNIIRSNDTFYWIGEILVQEPAIKFSTAISDPVDMEADSLWHYMVFTYDGSGGLAIYKDGVRYDNFSDNIGELDYCLNDEPLVLGMGDTSGYGDFNQASYCPDDNPHCTFGSEMDEAGIWSRELNSTEILLLYNNGTGYNPVPHTKICYQESPVTENQSGTDTADCGLNYSGSSILFTIPETDGLIGYVNETYIKPIRSENSSRIKYRAGVEGMSGEQYSAVPAGCWDYDSQKLYIQLKTYKAYTSGGGSYISCYNGTGWENIFGDTGASTEEYAGSNGSELTDGNWTTWAWYESDPVSGFGRTSDYSFLTNETMGCVIWETAVEWNVSTNCTPDWSCNLYGDCQTNDTRLCIEAIDSNICGENYTGDYSEFEPEECDYCTPSRSCTQHQNWCPATHTKDCITVTDANGCYLLTGLPSDDFDGDYSPYRTACGYNSTYNTQDVREETTDVIGATLMEIMKMAQLIVVAVMIITLTFELGKLGIKKIISRK